MVSVNKKIYKEEEEDDDEIEKKKKRVEMMVRRKVGEGELGGKEWAFYLVLGPEVALGISRFHRTWP